MLSGWFSWFIILWIIFLITMFSIGGYFMFRKFLKQIPKEDGMSILDWEDYYIQETKIYWNTELRDFLEKLIMPVPELFRDVARNKILGKIGELLLTENKTTLSLDYLIRGYILATPKRDHKFLKKTLQQEQIDIASYQIYFENNS